MVSSASVSGIVIIYDVAGGCARQHDRISRIALARRLAELKQFCFCEHFELSADRGLPVYVVPSEPIVGADLCSRLAIRSEDDLFGGAVPFPFVGTKAIAHSLVDGNACAPDGWSSAFTRDVADLVLDGYSVFSIPDAQRAGARLLGSHDCIRIKRVTCCGGRGQYLACDCAMLEQILTKIDPFELSKVGLVIEQNVPEMTTYSIGQVSVAGITSSYYGTQRCTTNNRGEIVYGGSDLMMIRGDFDALERQEMPDEAKSALRKAHAFDLAAARCFAGFMASRRNYDVACGTTTSGARVLGVLEQSWRPGGASSAEIEGLHVFRREPAVQAVRASSVELYGDARSPPAHAAIYFQGVDDTAAPLLKYAMVDRL